MQKNVNKIHNSCINIKNMQIRLYIRKKVAIEIYSNFYFNISLIVTRLKCRLVKLEIAMSVASAVFFPPICINIYTF